jgi:hypothetical protein
MWDLCPRFLAAVGTELDGHEPQLISILLRTFTGSFKLSVSSVV